MGKLAMDSRNGDSVVEGLDRFAVGLMQSCSAIWVKERECEKLGQLWHILDKVNPGRQGFRRRWCEKAV
jgi:hypothetical protein